MKEIENALKRAGTGPTKKTQKPADRVEPPRPHGLQPAAPPGLGSKSEQPLIRANFEQFAELSGGQSKQAQIVDGAFRVLRTQTLDAMDKQNLRVVGITSPLAGAGKTTTAIKLALACARRPEQSIVLADLDFRRPAIATYLHAEGFSSSIQFFQGIGTVNDFLSVAEEGNLRFLLTDEPSDMSAEYLAGSRMDEALKTLTRERSTAVIADLPPMVGCDDTIAIMPKLDGVILVVESGQYSYDLVERCIAQIPKDKLVAAVLNKVPKVDVRHQYTYQSYPPR
ncbi:MAG: CpsD/CapB family tyrosine-protein kinase [Parvularcula sp.]